MGNRSTLSDTRGLRVCQSRLEVGVCGNHLMVVNEAPGRAGDRLGGRRPQPFGHLFAVLLDRPLFDRRLTFGFARHRHQCSIGSRLFGLVLRRRLRSAKEWSQEWGYRTLARNAFVGVVTNGARRLDRGQRGLIWHGGYSRAFSDRDPGRFGRAPLNKPGCG